MRLKRKFPRIEVLWADHHSDHEDNWTSPSLPTQMKPALILTSGYLVSENSEMVEVARDIGYTEEDKDISAPMRIIKKCILHRKETP